MLEVHWILLFVSIVAPAIASITKYQPQQVHIAFGENADVITMTWSTMGKTDESIVKYGINEMNSTAYGSSESFIDGGKKKRTQYIHRVTLSNLLPRQTFSYQCGSDLGWSQKFTFKSASVDSEWSPELAIFGDLGYENAQSLPRLRQELDRYDAIIHNGDFAYDMDSQNAKVGDDFMRAIESIAANVPYMVCAGNHEEKYNFSNYRARFSMPGGNENHMYSFNLGPVHFIGFSTEAYYFLDYGLKLLVNQYEWLERDLQEANRPENRQHRPWIITFGHRPMYCSNDNDKDCRKLTTLIRIGLPLTHFFGLEDLFYDYGVDVEIWAHQHSYERLWPIYNYTVLNGSYAEPYKNPKAPVHLVTGSAGCKEGHADFLKNVPAWSAFHSVDYGYTRMKAHNRTHLYFEQVSDDQNGEVIDSIWIVKDQPTPAFKKQTKDDDIE